MKVLESDTYCTVVAIDFQEAIKKGIEHLKVVLNKEVVLSLVESVCLIDVE